MWLGRLTLETVSVGMTAGQASPMVLREEPIGTEILRPWKWTGATPIPCHLGRDRVLGRQLVPPGTEDEVGGDA